MPKLTSSEATEKQKHIYLHKTFQISVYLFQFRTISCLSVRLIFKRSDLIKIHSILTFRRTLAPKILAKMSKRKSPRAATIISGILIDHKQEEKLLKKEISRALDSEIKTEAQGKIYVLYSLNFL